MPWRNLHENVLLTLGAIVAMLVVASAAVALLRRAKPEKSWAELTARVKTWWVIVAIFAVVLALPVKAAVWLFACVSFLAFREFLSIVPTRRADRRVLFWAYLAIPASYYWVSVGWYGLFIIFIPVFVFLFVPLRMILIGETKGYLQAVGTIHWGLMTTVFCLSHVAYLLVLPPLGNPNGGGPGLVLFLVFLTQFNDVLQFLWGKSVGRRKVVPSVSPGKTYGGLVGGLATTVVIATAIGPLLTPLDRGYAALAGVMIGLGGFVGDVTISALKRDLGIKDSGTLLPGHGGILDRVDSLYYTAPLFFHFVYYLKY